MKTTLLKTGLLSTVLMTGFAFAQETATTTMRDYLAPEKTTRNIFEDPKIEAPEYDGVQISVGGDFALQFQSLDHSTKAVLGKDYELNTMGADFNLPTANLDINAYLAKGLKMHLRTYLSARHHNEAWVKGGYIQIDNLDFISKGLLSDLMKNARIKIGMDELNYGDAHFRRTDNAEAINNPFVENNIMDAFSTQAFGEIYYFRDGFMGMIGVSNGKLNQTATKGTNENKPSIYAKVGYDKQINSDLRVRLTGSIIKTNGLNTNGKLYSDDRAGSRYYYVLLVTNNANSALSDAMGTSNPSTGRFDPNFKEMTAFQFNPFIKYKGLEFFGTFEHASGNKLLNATTKRDSDGSYNQFAGELLYRFGGKEQFYIGGKYNSVSGKDYDGALERKIDRFNFAGGWYMTKNVLAKVEYVNQKYNQSDVWNVYDANKDQKSALSGGKFNGIVFEATIGF